MNIEIRYPVTTLMRVLKRIKAPKKASYEAMDYFMAIHGDAPCTAYEIGRASCRERVFWVV